MELLSHNFPSHTHHWESAEIVRQLIERGFIVDCINAQDAHLLKDVSGYDIIIDEWNNLPKWAIQNPNVKKLFYATGCEWIFHNKAELTRHEWLFHRKGVSLPASRQIPPILSPSAADLISFFGDDFNKATYGCYAQKIRKLWISTVYSPPQLMNKNWEAAKKQFLWFGGGGWVHKGLDLVIEAFIREPELQLHVCGIGLDANNTFWQTYGEAIEKAGNITIHGKLDPSGKEFHSLAESVCAVIFPSASEGCSGGVVQCLHYGLIPLVTEATGLAIHNEWSPLIGETDFELIDEIRQRCHELVSMSDIDLDRWSTFFREYALSHHTRNCYSQSLRSVLDELISSSK